jgi:uncharacterized protein YkwD
MGTKRSVFKLLCAAVLACCACACAGGPNALAARAIARSSDASASTYHLTATPVPAGSSRGSRTAHSPRRHSSARCLRPRGHHSTGALRHRARRAAGSSGWSAAGRKQRKRGAARAHARARNRLCGGHLRTTHRHRRHPSAHRRHRRRLNHRAVHRHSTHAPAHAPAAGRSSVCANASVMPTEENVQLVRDAILCLINRERQGAGERALLAVPTLSAAAEGHTEDMGLRDYFEHVSPGGETPSQRMRAAGYLSGAQSYEVGENIAFGTGWLATPRSIVAAWMASPGHRANILNAHFRDTGIGAFAHPPASFSGGQRGAVYTEDFGVISG